MAIDFEPETAAAPKIDFEPESSPAAPKIDFQPEASPVDATSAPTMEADMPTSDAGPAPAPPLPQPDEKLSALTQFQAEAAKAGVQNPQERLQQLQDQYNEDYLPKKRYLDTAENFFKGTVTDGQTPEKLQNARLDFALAENKLRKKYEETAIGGVAPIIDEQGGIFVPPKAPYVVQQEKEAARVQAEAETEKKRQENLRIMGREPRWWETFPQAVKGIAQDALVEGMRTFQNSNIWDAEKTQQMAMMAHDTNVIAGLGKGIPNDVARGTADVLALMAGNPAGKAGILTAAFKGAELARARTFDETGDENKANAAALNSLITLPILLATGQAASKFASGLLPEGASALKVGATELAAGATANVGTDLLIHAVEGQPYDWRSFTADALFALHGAWSRFGEAAKAKGDTAGAATAEQAQQKIGEELSNKGETPPPEAKIYAENIQARLDQIEQELGPRETFNPKTGRAEPVRNTTTEEQQLLDKLKTAEPMPAQEKAALYMKRRNELVIKEGVHPNDPRVRALEDAANQLIEQNRAKAEVVFQQAISEQLPKKPTGQPNAIENTSASPSDGGLRPRSEVQDLPTQEGGAGVQPSGQGGLAPEARNEAPSPEVTPPEGERNLGPGAANIEEFTPALRLGAYNAAVDEQRIARGLEPLMSEARKPDAELWDKTVQRIERDPNAPADLVSDINAGRQKTATDEQQTMLLWRIVDLHNRMDTEAQRILDPHADEADRVEARVRYERLEQERQATEEADRKVGTEQGRALRARRIMADENYNLAGLMRRMAVATGGSLTAEQTVKAKTDAEKVRGAKEKLDTEIDKVNAEREINAVKGKQGAPVDLEQQRQKIGAFLTGEQKKGTPIADLRSYIQKLAENFVRSGITNRDALLQAVHGVIEPIFHTTERQTMDLISGYGDFSPLNPDPVKAQLRDIKGQLQNVAKLEDIQNRVPLQKTGTERRVPSTEERDLIKKVNDAKKKFGVVVTDPATQLKSALDAIKTRLKNQIKDITFQIETGEKPKAGEPPPTDEQVDSLRALRDRVRQTLHDIEGDPKMTDEQRVKAATKALESQIAEYEQRIQTGQTRKSTKEPPMRTAELDALRARRDALKAQVEEIKAADQTANEERQFDAAMKAADEIEKKLASGDLATKGGKQFGPDTELVTQAKERLANLRDQLKAAREASPEATQAKLDATKASVEKSIAELDRKIQTEDFAATKKNQPTSPEIEALRAERDAMRKLFNELKRATLPKLTPEQRAQKALMTRLTKRTAELTAKLAAGDFTKPAPRTPTPLTPALVKAKADYERVKLDVDRGIEKLRLKNRTNFEKLADATAKWVRFGVLTGYSTLEKLTGAAIARVALNVPEEMVGSVARRVFPGVAARAPVEGRGFEPGVEAKALTSGLTQGWKDAFKLLSTGHSDLDAAFGHRDVAPRSWMDFVGSLHGALKSNVKRTFFTRAQAKLLLDAAAKGRDITDPMVQTQIAMGAYKEANRSIFLNSNRIVEGFQAMLARWAAPDSKTGKVSIPGKIAQTAAKVLVPVVRIPANIVAETLGQYAGGLLHGIPRAIKAELAIRKGASDLSPVEADAIMRSLKKGSIGTSLLLLGFFGYKNVGGYYAPGQKRDESKEPNFGEAQIFGFKIPKAFLHNPALEAIQLGATVRRVADSKLRKSDTEKQGLMAGIGRALLAASEEVPFIGEAMHLGDLKEAHGGEKFLYNQARTFTEPQILQQLAKYFDKDKSGKPVKRQEKSLMDVLKGGIPGLRQTVPVKR